MPPCSCRRTGERLPDLASNDHNNVDSRSGLNQFGIHVGAPESLTPTETLCSSVLSEPYVGDIYPAYSGIAHSPGTVDHGIVDGDEHHGLRNPRGSRPNSMLSANSDRSRAAGIGETATGGVVAGEGMPAALIAATPASHGARATHARNIGRGYIQRWRRPGPIIAFFIVAGAIVAGVVGSLVIGTKKEADVEDKNGGSASGGTKTNGDPDINSPEIKELMNNPDLHKVFPGMDYTPFNTQYPDCIHNPPSQNNITRDVAVLSQLTNKIRLYGTDCNQTQMVIHAVNQLKLTKDIKIWLGVWQDGNQTTNIRQLEQMWTILDDYGDSYFEGIIVANEVLFRKEMTIPTLSKIMDSVRTNLTSKKMNLPVATSDLGDNWTAKLGNESDFIMANVHPFFSGVTAEEAALWTYRFWKVKDGPFWKTDTKKNIISETGWPSAGGKNCGGAVSCDKGAVAGIKEMNRFMDDWVCQALTNGTSYFWFEAFDEPWKIRFNEKGKEWEDKWGLLDVNRKLKDGVKIPSCSGQTVSK